MTRRQRRLSLAIFATVSGLALLGATSLLLERSRDTDLQDANAGVTTERRHKIPDRAPALMFSEVAEASGIRMRHGAGKRRRLLTEDMGSGLAWGDYDRDGDPDLYVVNFSGEGATEEEGWNRLFRNDRGRFTDVTADAGVADAEGFGMGASFADFDADGWPDLYVANYGRNRLFRNRGDGSFEEVSSQLGVDDESWSVSVAWGDYDRDGLLDLYVANYVDFDEGTKLAASPGDPSWQSIPLSMNPNAFSAQTNRLFRQQADGTFADVSLMAGASNPGGRSLGVAFVDMDGDGWLDLYVANDVSPNALLRNVGGEGESGFEDRSFATGTADPRGSMGLSVADLAFGGEPDGLADFFITHWVAQENALYEAVRAADGFIEYRDRAQRVGLGQISTDAVGWGCAFVDLDRDGRVDLVVANGSTLEVGEPPELEPQKLFLFWNDSRRFWNLAPAAGEAVDEARVARGLAAADYDRDGDVDLAISVNRGAPILLRNDSPNENHWLGIRLAASEPVARGARVSVIGESGRQSRWYGADASFASGHDLELLFGLGGSPEAVTVEVVWMDGRKTEMGEVAVDRHVVVDRSQIADSETKGLGG
jgi:hypothetical protein